MSCNAVHRAGYPSTASGFSRRAEPRVYSRACPQPFAVATCPMGMRNLRLAFRTLVRTPFVTTIAVLSLALGIGANAAIFSTFDRMLLAPLPVQAPTELVNLSAPGPKPGSQNCGQAGDCDVVFSYPMFRDLEKAQTPFTGIAAHWVNDVNVAYEDHTSNTQAVFVSGQYFPVLGIMPAMGRLLGPSDDQAMGASPVAVLGY